MRLCFLLLDPRWDGRARAFGEAGAALRERGWEVVMACARDGDVARAGAARCGGRHPFGGTRGRRAPGSAARAADARARCAPRVPHRGHGVPVCCGRRLEGGTAAPARARARRRAQRRAAARGPGARRRPHGDVRVRRGVARRTSAGAARVVWLLADADDFAFGALDAFAAGAPVIAARSTLAARFVTDGENGCVFTGGDAAAPAARGDGRGIRPRRRRGARPHALAHLTRRARRITPRGRCAVQ